MSRARMLGAVVASFVLAASASLPAIAQTVQPERVGLSSARLDRIGDLVDRYIESGQISGAVTLVARNGRVAHLKAHGLADLAFDEPMREDTIFRVASMSKPVAAVAILMLVEEGKIRLTDPISRFIPGFADQNVAVAKSAAPAGGGRGGPPPEFYTVPADRQITILDVLTHTSGVMSGRMSNSVGSAESANRREEGLVWVEGIGAVPLEFQPGSRWSYSALAGFDVLSHIVEIASGRRFDEFLRDRIFEPLGMKDIFFWPDQAQRERLVTSYTRGESGLTARDNPDSMSSEVYFSGAGGLMSTAEGYARFAMMLANGGELDGTRILAPRTVELMGSAFVPDSLPGRRPGEGFGLGVRVVTDPVARRTPLSKGSFGWSGAYGTYFFVDPSQNLVGVLMIQTPIVAMWDEFDTAVMQAVIDL